MLDFIDEDETRGVVGWKAGANLPAEGYGITAEKELIGFKVDFYNVVRCDTAV
jgi:hypothetical protein